MLNKNTIIANTADIRPAENEGNFSVKQKSVGQREKRQRDVDVTKGMVEKSFLAQVENCRINPNKTTSDIVYRPESVKYGTEKSLVQKVQKVSPEIGQGIKDRLANQSEAVKCSSTIEATNNVVEEDFSTINNEIKSKDSQDKLIYNNDNDYNSDKKEIVQPKVIEFNHAQYIYEDNKINKQIPEKNSYSEYRESYAFTDKINKNESEQIRDKKIDDSVYETYNNQNLTEGNSLLEKNKLVGGNSSVDKKISNFLCSGSSISVDTQSEKKNRKQFLPSVVGEKRLSIFPLMTGAVAVSVIIVIVGFVSFGFQAKKDIEVRGVRAVNYIKEAKVDLQNKNFKLATTNLVAAKQEFKEAQEQIDKLGGHSLDVFTHIPFLSKISSGKNVVTMGDELTDAVVQLSKVSELLSGVGNPLDLDNKNKTSLTDIFVQIQESIVLSKESLVKAEEASNKININDLPEEYQEKIGFIKDFLPLVNDSLDEFDRSAKIFLELFGQYSSKKYLIVFQNNQEMRATGGFIGSYGLLETSQGKIDKLKIEGIYNPDGQSRVDVVPPRPIQKISAAWSTHDANWFPDFPKSAEKISWFYEKTGGPTVDGVIAVTPVLLQKMLEITGPIEMPEYNKTVTSKNFIKTIQQQVEVDYDKEDNKPKQILADLTPKLFAKFFDLQNPKQTGDIIKVMLDSLKEKHILVNFRNIEIQEIVSNQGWSGRVLQTSKDYLMIVNSNINGYKTDGVIKESISHQAKINLDGTIVDTVTITRKHKGGKTDYEWWNKVNADYMRVYVPEGSKLISASGHTREMNEEKLNYDKLGFQIDADVRAEESYMKIDEESGTRIYTENDKTVFANWVYVSPQERVTVVYKYLLPFKISMAEVDSNRYSLLVQKQSGSVNSRLNSKIEFPFNWNTSWVEPKNLKFDKQNNELSFDDEMDTDQFVGAVFQE